MTDALQQREEEPKDTDALLGNHDNDDKSPEDMEKEDRMAFIRKVFYILSA